MSQRAAAEAFVSAARRRGVGTRFGAAPDQQADRSLLCSSVANPG